MTWLTHSDIEEHKGVWVDQEIKENCNGLRVIKRVG